MEEAGYERFWNAKGTMGWVCYSYHKFKHAVRLEVVCRPNRLESRSFYLYLYS